MKSASKEGMEYLQWFLCLQWAWLFFQNMEHCSGYKVLGDTSCSRSFVL